MGKGKGTVQKLPKVKCCESRKKCGRCPLRMLKEGTLPPGYTVKRRRLVRLDGGKVSKKKLVKAA
jgi:aromatic ring-opening dioxygenase LigB subunit